MSQSVNEHRRSPSPALLAVLALLIALASALLAGPARAAAPITLTAAAVPDSVVFADPAAIAGSVSAPGAVLWLLESPAGASDWTPAGSTTAAPDGSYRFDVAPAVTTDYRVEVREGDVVVAQEHATVRVRPLLTTTFPNGLWLGGSVTLRGLVAPAHPGGAVTIDSLVDGVWEPLLTTTLDASSRFAIRWTPTAFGYYRLRARMDADGDHDTGVSRSERVTVNRPNAHRVPMRHAHYVVIVRHEYRLYYYEHGALVRRFDVVLGRPGYPTPLGLFRVYGKRKPAGGALGSCAMFYRRKGGIAIHGTNEPWLIRRPIPRRYSHGCARMLNREALWLYARVPVGTYVHNLR